MNGTKQKKATNKVFESLSGPVKASISAFEDLLESSQILYEEYISI